MKYVLIALLAFSPIANATDVVVYRDKGWPGARQIRILDDSGKVVGWVRKDSYFTLDTESSKILVEADENIDSVNVGEGTTYIRVVPKLGMVAGKAYLEIVSKETFEVVKPKLKELKDSSRL